MKVLKKEFNNITSVIISAYLISTLKFQFEKMDKFNNINSAMFNTYFISTLKFWLEKIDKLNKITSAMFNAYLISTLNFKNLNIFEKFKRSDKKI